ncbi:hypothetical protein BD410DRAFT_806957 [Rickenella mellea]|uniref:Uncharacterized protein n=1 Tax=Rickenella mellea TaxID=50990 RepID=A0A4Y7PSF8_9AGAM|nr:hypothetical protein BD410DRAFT_806957 [Rickenella mellea]
MSRHVASQSRHVTLRDRDMLYAQWWVVTKIHSVAKVGPFELRDDDYNLVGDIIYLIPVTNHSAVDPRHHPWVHVSGTVLQADKTHSTFKLSPYQWVPMEQLSYTIPILTTIPDSPKYSKGWKKPIPHQGSIVSFSGYLTRIAKPATVTTMQKDLELETKGEFTGTQETQELGSMQTPNSSQASQDTATLSSPSAPANPLTEWMFAIDVTQLTFLGRDKTMKRKFDKTFNDWGTPSPAPGKKRKENRPPLQTSEHSSVAIPTSPFAAPTARDHSDYFTPWYKIWLTPHPRRTGYKSKLSAGLSLECSACGEVDDTIELLVKLCEKSLKGIVRPGNASALHYQVLVFADSSDLSIVDFATSSGNYPTHGLHCRRIQWANETWQGMDYPNQRPRCKRKKNVSGTELWIAVAFHDSIWHSAQGEAKAELAMLNKIGVINAVTQEPQQAQTQVQPQARFRTETEAEANADEGSDVRRGSDVAGFGSREVERHMNGAGMTLSTRSWAAGEQARQNYIGVV